MTNQKNQKCNIALSQLYLHSSGEVYPCGFLQSKHSIGNIKKASLIDIWNSEKAKDFREKNILGVNEHCIDAQGKYNCHKLHLNMETPLDNEKSPFRLDIMIDSFCNLKCIMCTNRSEENQGFEDDKFWEELELLLPSLKELELVGGEPLVVKNTYKLFDLISKVNPGLRVIMTTNGAYDFNSAMRKYFDRLNLYAVSISIDSFDVESFKKIRVGGDLFQVLNSIAAFKDYNEKREESFYLTCNFLIQRDNYHEIEMSFIESKKLGVKFYPILLREPEEFSILNFDEEKLSEIVRDYIAICEKYKSIELYTVVMKLFKELNSKNKLLYIEEIERVGKELG